MALLSYTHNAEAAPWLRDSCLASVTFDVGKAHELARSGWKVALEVKRLEDAPTRIGGKTAIGCPEQVQKLRGANAGLPKVTCNTCRLCDAGVDGPHIVFFSH